MNFKDQILAKIRQTIYYWIIFLTSMVVLVFLPMVGSEAGLEFNIPTTTAGWILYIVTKLLVAVLNVIIFFSFMQQAKLNVRDDPKYVKACEIMGRVKKEKAYIPRAPRVWERKQYMHKGVTIFLTTAISVVALANAFLTYDYMTLLTYAITIIMGIIFGLLQMATAEEYWTKEFYDYAIRFGEDEMINNPQNEIKTTTEPILGQKGEE